MDISGAMSNAMYGMNRASDQVSQAGAEIASAPARQQQQQEAVRSAETQTATETATETSQSVNANANVTGAMVDLNVGEKSFQANARTFATADEMLGTLIDTRA